MDRCSGGCSRVGLYLNALLHFTIQVSVFVPYILFWSLQLRIYLGTGFHDPPSTGNINIFAQDCFSCLFIYLSCFHMNFIVFTILKNGIETLPSSQVAIKATQISMAPSGNIAQCIPDHGHLHGLWWYLGLQTSSQTQTIMGPWIQAWNFVASQPGHH